MQTQSLLVVPKPLLLECRWRDKAPCACARKGQGRRLVVMRERVKLFFQVSSQQWKVIQAHAGTVTKNHGTVLAQTRYQSYVARGQVAVGAQSSGLRHGWAAKA